MLWKTDTLESRTIAIALPLQAKATWVWWPPVAIMVNSKPRVFSQEVSRQISTLLKLTLVWEQEIQSLIVPKHPSLPPVACISQWTSGACHQVTVNFCRHLFRTRLIPLSYKMELIDQTHTHWVWMSALWRYFQAVKCLLQEISPIKERSFIKVWTPPTLKRTRINKTGQKTILMNGSRPSPSPVMASAWVYKCCSSAVSKVLSSKITEFKACRWVIKKTKMVDL